VACRSEEGYGLEKLFMKTCEYYRTGLWPETRVVRFR
jgi:hypothetical protein